MMYNNIYHYKYKLFGIFIGLMLSTGGYAEQYTLSVLPSLGGRTEVKAINNQGDVVGEAIQSNEFFGKAVLWKQGKLFQLTGQLVSGAVSNDINELGEIVGSTDEFSKLGFHWGYGVLTPLDTLLPEDNSAQPQAINNLGLIVGYSEGLLRFPTLWWRGTAFDINSLISGGDPIQFSAAYDINNQGDVVGTGSATPNGVLLSKGIVTDLGSLAGLFTQPIAINESKQIVGYSNVSELQTIAFLWENGVMTSLGILPGGLISFAYDINENGSVVGASNEFIFGQTRAVLWENGNINNLNNLIDPGTGWTLVSADAINDSGVIAGVGTAPDSQIADGDPYILTPINMRSSHPTPGQAGVDNTFTITEATPGQWVVLVFGINRGITMLSNCHGFSSPIEDIALAGFAQTGPDGSATISVPIPEAFTGQTILFQSIQLTTCEMSNLVTHAF